MKFQQCEVNCLALELRFVGFCQVIFPPHISLWATPAQIGLDLKPQFPHDKMFGGKCRAASCTDKYSIQLIARSGQGPQGEIQESPWCSGWELTSLLHFKIACYISSRRSQFVSHLKPSLSSHFLNPNYIISVPKPDQTPPDLLLNQTAFVAKLIQTPTMFCG